MLLPLSIRGGKYEKGMWDMEVSYVVELPDAKPGFGASRYSLGSKVCNHLISWEIPSLQIVQGDSP